jgi:hypothetical protein
MNFLHTDFHGGPADVAIVSLDGQANVLLVDDSNFAAYKRGASFQYFGGWATRSPVRLTPPHENHWNVIVDLGGANGHVKAGVQVVSRS